MANIICQNPACLHAVAYHDLDVYNGRPCEYEGCSCIGFAKHWNVKPSERSPLPKPPEPPPKCSALVTLEDWIEYPPYRVDLTCDITGLHEQHQMTLYSDYDTYFLVRHDKKGYDKHKLTITWKIE